MGLWQCTHKGRKSISKINNEASRNCRKGQTKGVKFITLIKGSLKKNKLARVALLRIIINNAPDTLMIITIPRSYSAAAKYDFIILFCGVYLV